MHQMKSDELELPIQREVITGPGVDALAARKETDNAEPMTADKLRMNWLRMKDSMMAGLKRLCELR